MQSSQTPFFTLTGKGSFVHIESTNRDGATGEIRLAQRHAAWLFHRLGYCKPASYSRWLASEDVEEIGVMLFRIDGHDHEHRGRLRVEVGRHPSSGSLVLGQPEQEQEQLHALLQLGDQVMHLFEISQPDETMRARTAERAQTLLRQAKGLTFLPPEGYCYRCEQDVTLDVTDATGMTGCPKCHVSWCD